MLHLVVQPHESLRLFVKEYLVVHFDFGNMTEIPSKVFPPRADSSLIFYPTHQFRKINPQSGRQVDVPRSVVQGQLLTNWYHHYAQEFTCVKIVFQPGGLYHLLGKMPMTYLLDETIEAESVVGKEVNSLFQQLMDMGDYMGMIRALEAYLLQKYQRIRLVIEPIDKLSRLFTNPGAYYSLDYLASQACLSIRQFERKFKERTGVSPRLFTRLVRFNQAFELKDEHPDKDWLDIALSCGYADYQHMVKDFKQFAGLTPVGLMRENEQSVDKRLGIPKVVVF